MSFLSLLHLTVSVLPHTHYNGIIFLEFLLRWFFVVFISIKSSFFLSLTQYLFYSWFFSVYSCSLGKAFSFFFLFICNLLLPYLGRYNSYPPISFHLTFPFITIIIMSAMPFRSTIDCLILKILRIIFVDLFVILTL